MMEGKQAYDPSLVHAAAGKVWALHETTRGLMQQSDENMLQVLK